MRHETYTHKVWNQFKKKKLGYVSLFVVILFSLVGIYAPFLASSKPILVIYDGAFYFPLFRYLFYIGFYTKGIDIFFNILMFIFPLILLAFRFFWPGRRRRFVIGCLIAAQLSLFVYYITTPPRDPASDPVLNRERYKALDHYPDWNFELRYMNDYAKLNTILRYRNRLSNHETLSEYSDGFVPSLWQLEKRNREKQLKGLREVIEEGSAIERAEATLQFYEERERWLAEENGKISFIVMPIIRHFHWEEDAGGEQSLNQHLPWWELTRINRKDLVAALIFGVRVSLVVGILAVSLALIIGIPIGAFAGYSGGRFDIIVSRLLEIWESMPTFFMLLLVVAITQNKSIFLVITVIGFFGWTGFSRYIRGEFFKQRNLPYVEACHAQGYSDSYIMFSHILPNAIPPILTLLPFAVMGAITSEAGLSFLGLGEEGSSSWGVLMDEGRSAFPGESYLLWPPAILLTVLLVAIALVGDAMRDALDPKLVKEEQ